jgi:hypothetical protein
MKTWGRFIFCNLSFWQFPTENKNEEFENLRHNLSDLDEKRQSFPERTFQLFGSYMLVHSFYTLSTMSFNFIARRHLMVKPHSFFLFPAIREVYCFFIHSSFQVWRVFAPKYIFDSLMLLVVDVSLFIILIKNCHFQVFKGFAQSLNL